MRVIAIAGTGILALTAVAGCGGHTRPAAPAASPSSVPPAAATSCRAADLQWRRAGGVVGMTGEHAEMFGLVNRGSAACAVRGYPAAVLYDGAGAALPFRYAQGGGMYVTARKPAAVTLQPGATAYVVVAKYRCDLGIKANAEVIRLTLRLSGGAVVSRRLRLPVTGAPGLSYCTGGRRDPGQLVTISPLEPSQPATRPATAS